jgi:hypothetical protein
MRRNLQFQLKMVDGTSEHDSHRNIMNVIVETIRQLAPSERVCVFVMYELPLLSLSSRFCQLTNRLKVCVPSGQSGGNVVRSIQRCAMPRLIFVYYQGHNANTCSDEGRNIVRFGGERRPNITNLDAKDIVVATAALQTGELQCFLNYITL